MNSNHKVSYIASSVSFVSASAKMSSVEDEVFDNIGKLTFEQLVEVYGQLGLPDLPDDQKTKAVVLKLIRRFLSSEDLEKTDDKGVAHFLWIQTFMDSVLTPGVKTEASEEVDSVTNTSSATTSATSAIMSVSTGNITTTVQNLGQGLLKSKPPPGETVAPSKISIPSASVDLADLQKALKKILRFKVQ